jgi:2-polyprenyl-3-methyl-5-hydroxy-6-metoxy-1,4-benzoquinol methylase
MLPHDRRFELFLRQITAVDPALASTTLGLEQSWGSGGGRDNELTELVTWTLERAIEQGMFTLSTMVEGYQAFAHEFHERQLEFLCSREYRAKNYAEVSRDVYLNDEYMARVYYPALLFSYLAAPNYRHILRRLDDTLGKWRAQNITRVCEVGSGHAFLLLFALRQLPLATGVGTDFAPAAGRFAEALQRVTGWGAGRFEFTVQNVLDEAAEASKGAFDAAICCELLEHVPEPERFLRVIHQRLRPGGRLFVSTAVRMDAVDHLTLFEDTGEVRALLADAGFAIIEEMSVPFVTRPPRDAARWQKLLADPHTAVTFLAECNQLP